MKPDGRSEPVTGTRPQPFLNEPQQRHFEVFLSMLEDALTQINRLAGLSATGAEGNLNLYDADLPARFAESAEPILASIRSELANLAELLEIKPRHRSQTRTVRALLTAELVRLDDSYPNKLRGYGSVDPRAHAALEPTLDRIRSGLTALLKSLGTDEPTARRRGIAPRE
jgi:hypothetical protein